jgi:hypothetical protein
MGTKADLDGADATPENDGLPNGIARLRRLQMVVKMALDDW